MKLVASSSLILCLALSACATDYASQLSEPNFGNNHLRISEENVDPTLLMNGAYASKQMNGSYGSASLGAFCLTANGCSRQAPLWSSGWAP
jgi:hypothetical protein